jgi:hypothetical protein
MRRLWALFLVALAVGCGSEESAPVGTPSVPIEPPPPPPATVTDSPVLTQPGHQKGLPAAVAQTRAAILEAAQLRDFDALAELIPDSGFTFSYGSGDSAIDYWKDLEAAGEQPPRTMGALLLLEYTRAGDIYVWPWAYDKDPANLTDAQKQALAGAGAATVDQLDQMAELGHYLGWRLGVREDGTWMFFVAGD